VKHRKAEGPDAVTANIGPQVDQQSERISLTPISQAFDAQRTGGTSRAVAYSALLLADGYSEQARQALRDGDDDAGRHNLAVLRALVEVALAQLREDRQ
jgi:hypothetical protein